MAQTKDIRTLVVKLLKAHKLRFVNLWSEQDPQSGARLTLLKFRRDKEHSPKAFFDDLNENGLQYKKLSKDPNALEIVCELHPRGTKQRVTKAREQNKKNVRSQGDADGGQGSAGNTNGKLNYMGIPSGTGAKLIQSDVQNRTAGEQNWEEFYRRVSKMLQSESIHDRPEIRQLREQLASAIVDAMGSDSSLYNGMRTSDLENKIKDVLCQNIDLVFGTRELANSVIRRSASPTIASTATMLKLRRGCVELTKMAAASDDARAQSRAIRLLGSVNSELQNPSGASSVLTNPVAALLLEGKTDDAFLALLG